MKLMGSDAIRKLLLLSGLLMLLYGCVMSPSKLNAPEFTPHKLTNPNNAVIYVYRTFGEKYAYSREYHMVSTDNDIKVTLKHGGYYPLEVKPGMVKIAADRSHKLTLLKHYTNIEFNVEKGKSYYVKLGVDASGWNVIIDLSKRNENDGLNDLKSCRLLKLE